MTSDPAVKKFQPKLSQQYARTRTRSLSLSLQCCVIFIIAIIIVIIVTQQKIKHDFEADL